MVSFSLSAGADKVLSLECFFEFKNQPAIYFYTIITIIAPLLILFLIISMIKALNFFSEKNWFNVSSGLLNLSTIFYIGIIAIMQTYDEIITKLIENFSFLNVDDESNPDFRLLTDFDLEFYSKEHTNWLNIFVIPITLLIGVIIPGFVFINMKKAKKTGKLSDEKFLFRFGYFFFAYDKKYLFYEAFYIFRKIFLITIDIFFIKTFTLSKTFQPMTFLVLMSFFYSFFALYTRYNSPYNEREFNSLNKIEAFSLTTQAIMCWLGSLLWSFNYMQDSLFLYIVELFILAFGLLINVFILVFWVFLYWKASVKGKFNIVFGVIKHIGKKSIQTAFEVTRKLSSPRNSRQRSSSNFSPSKLFAKDFSNDSPDSISRSSSPSNFQTLKILGIIQ